VAAARVFHCLLNTKLCEDAGKQFAELFHSTKSLSQVQLRCPNMHRKRLRSAKEVFAFGANRID
jgi:hypothetical protein